MGNFLRFLSLYGKKQQTNPFIKALVSLGGFNPSLTHEKDIELYIQQVANMDPAIFFNLIQNYDRYDATAWLAHH